MRNIVFVLILGILFFSLYLFNDEKFFPEYWLQKKYDNYRIEKLDNVYLSGNSLSYHLVYNEKIDVNLSLYSNGIVSVTRNKLNNQKQERTTFFISDSIIIQGLINDFNSQYSKSAMQDIDDHISKYYSVMTFKTSNSSNDKKIEFYNVKPDKKFKTIKNKIVSLAKNELDKLVE